MERDAFSRLKKALRYVWRLLKLCMGSYCIVHFEILWESDTQKSTTQHQVAWVYWWRLSWDLVLSVPWYFYTKYQFYFCCESNLLSPLRETDLTKHSRCLPRFDHTAKAGIAESTWYKCQEFEASDWRARIQSASNLDDDWLAVNDFWPAMSPQPQPGGNTGEMKTEDSI